MSYKAVCIPGDGIGPEITAATLSILRAAGAPVEFEEHPAGVGALEKGLEVLPETTLKAISRHKVALKGPCSTPIGGGFTSVNVGLRKRLNLFAAVRPVRSLKGVPTRFENVDLIVIRENTEGLYSGLEHEVVAGVVASLKVATEDACGRIAHWAFRFATHRRRKKITVFHKANIMKLGDGMFRRNAQRVHREDYPNIDLDELIIDAGCMRLVQDPSRFDILLMENLYGCGQRFMRRHGRRTGCDPGRQLRRAWGSLRGGPRLGAGYRRERHCQSIGLADVGRDYAALPGRAARGQTGRFVR